MADDTKKLFMNDAVLLNPTVAGKGITNTPTASGVTNAQYTSTAPQPPVAANKSNPNMGNGIPNNATNTTNGVTLAFSPNMLDYYDATTYHWKLFMVSMDAAKSGNILDLSAQTIIAESGVTDLTIDKVEINSVASPSIESGVGTMTTLKFEIVEPSGAGLLDQIYYDSLALGIGNWLVNPYYLQLQFRGRNPNDEESVINGGDTGIGALNWVWPIKITNAKINVTQVGTKYEFDAIFYNEVAQTNACFSLMHNITLKELTNFKSAMTDLQTKLNQDAYEKLIDNYSIPDTYTIVVDDALGKINLINPTDKKSSSRAADFVDFSKRTATFNSGTSVDSIVNSLLGSTDEIQKALQGADAPDAKPKSGEAEVKQMKKLWRIITETKPIAFDSLRQDNAKAYTIYIIEYNIGVVDANTSQTQVDAATQKKRLAEYMSRKILRKRYNYFFTGLNDQIRALDLNMNFSFAAAVSRFGGVYVDSQVFSKGVTQQKNAENEKKAGEIIRSALEKINNAKPGEDVSTTIANAQKAIKASAVSDVVKSRYSTLLAHASPTDRTAFTKTIQEQGGLDAGAGMSGNMPSPNSLAASVPSSAGNLQFISDVNIRSTAAAEAVKNAAKISSGKLRPIPVGEATQESNMPGVENSSDAGRARTSSLFATALYSGLDASLMKIKLTIKGDPFWLFPRNISSGDNPLNYLSGLDGQAAVAELKNAQTKYDSSVDLYSADNFIIIRMRTPKIYNEVTGFTEPYVEVDTYSGVYKVITITSRFDNGVFNQEIDAILDPVINFADIRDFITLIEKSSEQPEAVDPPAISGINTMASKQQRLTSNSPPLKGQDNTGATPASSVTKSFGKSATKPLSNVPYDTSNSSDNLFLPEGP